MANKAHEKILISLVIKEMQIYSEILLHTHRMATTQKTGNNTCQQGYGTTGNLLVHCRWECKIVQLLWKTLWQFLKMSNLPYDPVSSTPRYTPSKKTKNISSHKTLYINVYSSIIHNSQKTRNNPNVHQLTEGEIKCGISIQQNNTQL